jgi:hypothetical protein
MLAVMSLVGLNLSLFVAGFIYGFNSVQEDPGDVTLVIALVFVPGAIWFVTFLVKSLISYSDHAAVDRQLMNRRTSMIPSATGSDLQQQVKTQGHDPISVRDRESQASDPSTRVRQLNALAADWSSPR